MNMQGFFGWAQVIGLGCFNFSKPILEGSRGIKKGLSCRLLRKPWRNYLFEILHILNLLHFLWVFLLCFLESLQYARHCSWPQEIVMGQKNAAAMIEFTDQCSKLDYPLVSIPPIFQAFFFFGHCVCGYIWTSWLVSQPGIVKYQFPVMPFSLRGCYCLDSVHLVHPANAVKCFSKYRVCLKTRVSVGILKLNV